VTDLDTIESELAKYEKTMTERPRLVALNKIDVPEARELADFVKEELRQRGFAVYEVSAASTEGLKELKYAMAELVQRARDEAPEPEPSRVVIRPAAARGDQSGFEVVRTPDGFYLVKGEKPVRWVRQTDFGNDEAVGYLADRLARLGVEEALARNGAQAGDTILIGDEEDAVVFDWDPTLPTSGGHMPGPRGSDWRLE